MSNWTSEQAKGTHLVNTCCVCGHQWESLDAETRKIKQAVKVNKQGPYCGLCQSLEMAERYAKLRGFRSLQEALKAYRPIRPHT